LYVANLGGGVSVFAPGSTTPTGSLAGLNAPFALAFDANGNLFVANSGANSGGTTVSVFAPVTPAAGGGAIRSAPPGQPIQVGAPGPGLAVSNAELARVFTTAAGAVTFGDPSQTGPITFAGATPATTPGAGVAAVQEADGQSIVLDSTGGAPALAAG